MATHDTQVPMILGVIIPLTSLALFVVTLRVFTRAVLLGKIGVDDYFAIISFALYSSTILYDVAITALRMTFLAQYYRAFAAEEIQKALIVATVIVSGWCLSQICIDTFFCQPISTFWNQGNGGKCLPEDPLWYINSAGNIITDLIILVIPLPYLIKLRLASRQRYILVAIFSFGFVTCVISAIRIRYIVHSPDLTWALSGLGAWSIAELCCGLLCACLSTLRPLISRLMTKFLSLRQTSRTINTEQRQEHASGHTYRDIELCNGIERRSTSKGSQHDLDNQDMETGEQMWIVIALDDDERRLTGGTVSKP
ncbi:hypothetical protein FANTH_13740 [Fusarium anthophilum]|uniref:Rhodopsin domain-containing protein n=1 Tax=Fusarium anthophilum TaxID=48485 RepID=A0A8H5DP88_9HYPO|nr:hypothetical protein FANTH_13740 [Fusarium anthophilum]